MGSTLGLVQGQRRQVQQSVPGPCHPQTATHRGNGPPCLSFFKFCKRKMLDSKFHFGSKSPHSKLDVGFQETGLNLYWFLDNSLMLLRVCVCVCVSLVAQSCLTLCDPMDCSLPGSSVHGMSPGKNAGVGSPSLLQGIFPIQGLNLSLLYHRQILYHLSHQGSPVFSYIHIFFSYFFLHAVSMLFIFFPLQTKNIV